MERGSWSQTYPMLIHLVNSNLLQASQTGGMHQALLQFVLVSIYLHMPLLHKNHVKTAPEQFTGGLTIKY